MIYGLGTGTQPKVIKGGGAVVVPLLQSVEDTFAGANVV